MFGTRPLLMLLALTFAACSGDTTTQAPKADSDAAAHSDEKKGEDAKVSKEDLAEKATEKETLVPSPVETQKALEAAGIEAKLADHIQEAEFKTEGETQDRIAIRTGVVIARMLLTVKTAEDAKLVAHLEDIKTGMKALEGGDDIHQTIVEIQDQVKAGAANRDNLLKELDELSGAVIPELEFNGKKRIVPLIQAGSWLEGLNLVARAVKAAGKPAAADQLLKQPAVISYFQKYVKEEGAEKAPAGVAEVLDASLSVLSGLASKAESFTEEDVDAAIKSTSDVLALL